MNKILRTLAIAVIAIAGFFGTEASAQTGHAEGKPAQEGNRADGRIVNAVQMYEDENFTGAKTMLDAILKTSPDNDAAWYYRGLCNMRLKKAADSERDLKQAWCWTPRTIGTATCWQVCTA